MKQYSIGKWTSRSVEQNRGQNSHKYHQCIIDKKALNRAGHSWVKKKKKINLDQDLTTLRKLIQNGNRSKILRCKYLCKILNYKILKKQNIKENIADHWFLCSQFSHSVMSDSLRPHGLQNTSLCCSSTPRACSNSCSLSWWCHLAVRF